MQYTVYLKRAKRGINAKGTYDAEKNTLTVKSGSLISKTVSPSLSFRSLPAIIKTRSTTTIDNKVISDVVFRSPSTAANYVLGVSTNGLLAWKDENDKSLKELL